MNPDGTQVSLRAVLGGLALLGLGYGVWTAWCDGEPLGVLAGELILLLLSAASLALLFRKTRHDPSQRGMRRWLLETLKLAGTVAIGLLAVYVAVRGYGLLGL